MWIRSYKGNLIFVDITKYFNEKDLYGEIWRIKYNIVIEEEEDFNAELISMIES